MKQINLFSQSLKEAAKYIGWVLLFIFLWFRGCSGDTPKPQTTKVTVPEVKASFEAKKPNHELIEKVKKRPTKSLRNNFNKSSSVDFVDNEKTKENEKLKSDFAKETDSLKKIIAYNKAVKLNKFSTKFEDENLLLNIDGIVQGEVQEVTPNYTIKKKEVSVSVKQKETVFRVLAGGAVGINKGLNQAAYQLDLNFQNRKGNIISAEYLNVGNQDFGMLGYKHSIINIKR
jgi:HD superfamily phosphohydrolase